ncbi:hypothetical protein [Halobaculum sp. MBLA0143]|uniref:hypothetical protein n=1 Tax=Halobaculum sp. MBLA0143 TaxID=3079933 RepID=UPI003524A55E
MGVSLGPFGRDSGTQPDHEGTTVGPVHRECRHCGQNLSADVDQCGVCGGRPAVYEVQ